MEAKVDKLLDPELGIYPKLAQVEAHITRWLLGISVTITAGIVADLLSRLVA